ncbi:MAG: D-aminoacyl-tRNA deacylase [Flavobacteriaceae bacterium]
MRAVIQRVSKASVEVEGKIVGAIENGFMVLLGVTHEDGEEDAKWLATKLAQMRVFSDEEDKMNLDISQVGGRILVVSQFTLYSATKKGNRPSFINAARPEQAERLYQFFISFIEECLGTSVECGVFGADMKVSLVNDGPVTLIMDTKNKE